MLRGRHGERDAAGDHQRRHELRIRQPGRGDQADSAEAHGLQEQAADHQRPFADAIDQRTRDRGEDESAAGPRNDPQARIERPVRRRARGGLGDIPKL